MHAVNEASFIPPIVEHVGGVNTILHEKRPVGPLLTAVFGYNGNPALTEILAYGAYFIAAWFLWKNVRAAPSRRPGI